MTMVDMIGAFERHVMPNGDEVFYRDSDHSYYSAISVKGDKVTGIKDARLTGISTVSAPFDWQPDGLMKWAARMTGVGVAALASEGLSLDEADDMRATLGWLNSGDAIWDALSNARLTFNDIKDQAGARGTNVHKHALHALAQGKAVPDFAAMTEEERGYAQGVVAFWLAHSPKPIVSEHVVCDLELGVAGRLDLICEIAGGIVLLDAKTSGFIPTKHHVQVAGYDHCARTCGVSEVADRIILQVNADGGYEPIPVQADAADFKAAVDVYRRSGRIGREAGAARRESEKALAA